MWAAAEGHSNLGIPAAVGREFVGSDGHPRAAGIMITAQDGRALFVRRALGDHAGTWAFPGGMAEGGETPSQAALREFREETGHIPLIADALHHFIGDDIEFVTHASDVDVPFVPLLNEEHSAFAWAHPSDPPQPLHPGVARMLADKRARDEAFEEAYDARRACGADEAMAMDYADRVVSLLGGPATHRAGIAFDRESVRSVDSDGRMHIAKANISKATVNPYIGREIPDYESLGLDPDRVYKLLRHPDEIAKAVKSFNNLPLLSEHVPVSADDHQPEIVVGSLGTDAKYEHPFLTNSLVVWAKHGIDGIKSDEQKELSSAYRYTADMTPGEYEGEPYDGVMRDIVGNHVALVKKGRAGSDVVVGDEHPQEIEIMTKTKLSRAAVLLHGAITASLLPKLAKDAAIDLAPVLAKITAKNFKAEKANIVAGVKTATKGKLAKDASLEDVTALLDNLEKAGVDELDPKAAPGPMGGENESDDYEAMDENEQAKAFLASKLTPADLAEYQRLCAAGAGDEFPPKKEGAEKDEDEEKKDKVEANDAKRARDADPKEKPDMVDKKAMDAALAKVAQDTETKVMARVKAIADAKEAVEPYVGKIKVAMDSAEKVYVTALGMLGVDGIDDLPLKALEKILSAQMKQSDKQKHTTVAQDEASAPASFYERFPGAQRITVSR